MLIANRITIYSYFLYTSLCNETDFQSKKKQYGASVWNFLRILATLIECKDLDIYFLYINCKSCAILRIQERIKKWCLDNPKETLIK